MTGMELAAGAVTGAATAAGAAAVRRALKRPEGEGHPVNIDKEMEALIAKVSDNLNSPEEFKKNMKVLGNLSITKLNIGIYKKKVITYKKK